MTALAFAAASGRRNVIENLLDNGAEVDPQVDTGRDPFRGWTPIDARGAWWPCRHCESPVVERC
jgi:hypothetical protein